jgi:long-chain acyl-CoA synthetase
LPPLAVGATRDAEPEPVSDDPKHEIGALIYTSGTTGAPKGVMLTHANLLHVAHWSGALRGMTDTDRVLAALPISHVFGLASVFLASTLYGATVHLVARFDPQATLALVARERVTVFQGVPAMFARLLEHVRATTERPSLQSLRYASAGGSPLDMTLKRDAERLLEVPLNNGYGMTELAPTVSTTLMDQPRTDDSVGPPLPGIEIRIVDAEGRIVAPGATGLLKVRGPTVMRGYYRAEQATAHIIDAEGFLDTGDLARQDCDGALFIVGRAKDLIIHSGFNVHPEEIEAVLTAHRDVTLAAVVGRSGASGNEDVIAFVQLAPGAITDETALRAWCAERLAPYKRPLRIVALAALPASSTGKIRKSALRETARDLGSA